MSKQETPEGTDCSAIQCVPIHTFTADYIAELKDGHTVTVPDVTREIFFMPGEGEVTSFAPSESAKIEAAIERERPGYFLPNNNPSQAKEI